MTEALTIPMIGQTYPLPRGGGFVCSRPDGGRPSEGGLSCVLECVGMELGARRRNWFYASASEPAPTLDRVRWVILAPRGTPRAPWRALFLVLSDSLSAAMGRPTWSGADSTDAMWTSEGFTTAMRLHGDPNGVDSLEMECVSERLATSDPREQTP